MGFPILYSSEIHHFSCAAGKTSLDHGSNAGISYFLQVNKMLVNYVDLCLGMILGDDVIHQNSASHQHCHHFDKDRDVAIDELVHVNKFIAAGRGSFTVGESVQE